MEIQFKVKIILSTIIILFVLGLPNSPSSSIMNDCQFESFTFTELGYTTTKFVDNQQLNFQINCTGSNISYYTVKIYVHSASYRANLRYLVNGGILLDDLSSGWGNATISPGKFMEGVNVLTFDIAALNHDPLGYVTIFSDSYLEIINENDPPNTTVSEEHSITTSTTENNDFPFIELLVSTILGSFLIIGGYYLYNRNKKSPPFKTKSKTIIFAPTSKAYFCGLCGKKHIAGTPQMQCTTCGRSICVDSYSDMIKVGKKSCPSCEGKLEPSE